MATTIYGLRFSILIVVLALAGCDAANAPLFERVPASTSGVTFRNDLTDTPDFNILTYLYYYDGGGVSVGDVNNDGLPDLYFTANDGPNRLYLNRGDLRFEDVTEQAGVTGIADWTKGTTMADVNGDGWLDLYVCAINHENKRGRNALFINNGDAQPGQAPTFTEHAADYGLDFQGYSTQAAFFDYDRDGDLDMYLVNHSVHSDDTYGHASLRKERHPEFGDRLYRNDEGRFTDVSEQAGIYGGPTGYGLGVAVSDLNGDGWPDLFVSNDFHENDYLYLNNQNGTFREVIETAMGHTSRSSMGNDAADFDNDGRIDLFVLDMMPSDEAALKTADSAEPYDLYNLKRRFGYHDQLIRNTLQLNRGRERFSDIALLAGVYATDWSWGGLFADLDNDGRKDLFVTNGIPHRPNDLDYVVYATQPQVQNALAEGLTEETMQEIVAHMPEVRIANYAFRNEGDLTFANEAAAWGLAEPGISNGAAYADLDNDGDLDLVINNTNDEAWIYENRAAGRTDRHFLAIDLEGAGGNTEGIGARVLLKHGDTLQLQELMPTRGWASSVDPRLHFGLGAVDTVETLVAIWPDGRFQRLDGVAANQRLTLRQADASGDYYTLPEDPPPPLFEDVTAETGLAFRHEENPFVDFTREELIPHRVSTLGPALAVGDVNGDGLDDVFAGGAKHQPSRLFVQQPDGVFHASNDALWRADSLYEDVDAAFFDADADGDLDLYVVSSGNEFWGTADALRDRLYANDGAGTFTRAQDALPARFANGCCVRPADYDGDGDTDLFVGTRVVARDYGAVPESYLLENDGRGHFTDVTLDRAPGLLETGMVTDAAWTDIDGDGNLDLVAVGEWIPVRVYRQENGRFVEHTSDAGLDSTEGWWSAVHAADLDGDGDDDLILGNLGLNARLKASPERPVRLYMGDLDGNSRTDKLLTYYNDGVRYPLALRDEFLQAFPSLATELLSYADYGASRLDDLFPPERIADAVVREAVTFASVVAENDGAGRFMVRRLPTEAQFAPINAVLTDDFDADGHLDALVAGNFFGVKPERGRFDASYGLLLRGDGHGHVRPMDLAASNLILTGEVRALRQLRATDGARLLLAARNDAPIQVIRRRYPPDLSELTSLRQPMDR